LGHIISDTIKIRRSLSHIISSEQKKTKTIQKRTMKEVNTNLKEKTVNKNTSTMMREMGVVTIMVMVMLMRRRIMVIIMRMADRFVEHRKEAVQSSRKQTPNGKGTNIRGRRDYNLGQYCPQRCRLLASRLETLVRSGRFGASLVGSTPQQRS
jgi:hypothetical protein